tara:strand:- start:1652 stop:2158 length:507 start_codon:yes stop_codon:yes gene_type:complete
MREREYEQGVGDPFDAPVPGQSLTDTPGNYPWEHPPQFTDPEEVTEYLWVTMHQKQLTEQLIAMLDAGVPVEAIGRTILFAGFMEGKFSPDIAFLITEPVMKMIAAIGLQGGVEKIVFSLEDLTNKKQIREITKVKMAKEKVAEITESTQADIKKAGLMSRPEPEGEE